MKQEELEELLNMRNADRQRRYRNRKKAKGWKRIHSYLPPVLFCELDSLMQDFKDEGKKAYRLRQSINPNKINL